MRTFLLFFGLQFLSYMNLTLHMRAIAHEWFGVLTFTSLGAPLLAWLMVEHVSHDHSGWSGRAGVMAGGAAATLLGVWLTKGWV